MKTVTLFLLAAFLLLSVISFSQNQNTVFENASLIKSANGSSAVSLSWKKGAENTAYYLVERSVDGNTFKPIALVFTAENADFVNYKYKDNNIASASGTVYYRIAIVNNQKILPFFLLKK